MEEGIATKEHKKTQRTRRQKKNFYKNSLRNLRTQEQLFAIGLKAYLSDLTWEGFASLLGYAKDSTHHQGDFSNFNQPPTSHY
ncbi:MAG: hypothetical protein A3F67_06325 [Verrucomicrobia bacterium RIFCSPHIGHO2_12_FULL_41_10]|nr:MAG: hypothetical protein A3F67_06325 [Verrucomicrobia bacterium RIFCSPHIGHO2_12_FULL_41_10]